MPTNHIKRPWFQPESQFILPRPLTLFGAPIEWVETTRYLGVTLDKQITWSPHIDQVRRKTAQRMGMLGPLLNRRSDLSVRSAARSHVRRLQVLQSKCLRLATGAPWYVSNRRIHEDLGVPLLADHIRGLTESFDSKLADVGNPLVRQLGRYLNFPRAGPIA